MIKRTLKRTLSIVLTLVLLATTFFIFDPSVLKMDADAWVDVQGNTIGSSLAVQTANAPETVYLKPGGNQFYKFSLINANAGTADASLSDTGTVTFTNSKATTTKLYVNNLWKRKDSSSTERATNTYETVAPGTSLKLASTNTTATPSANITPANVSGSVANNRTTSAVASGATVLLSNGSGTINYPIDKTQCYLNCSEGDVYVIEWVVEYVIGGVYHYAFMYTGIYKERLQLVGVSGRGKHTTTMTNVPKAAGFAFLTGAMDYYAAGNRSCVYVGATEGLNCHPLIKFVGQQNNSASGQYTIPNVDDGYESTTNFPTTGTKTVLVIPGVHDAKSNGNNYAMWTTWSNMGTYNSPTATGGTNHDDTNRQLGTDTGSHVGVAYMVVDTSRFTNYSQVPFLSAGFIRYYHDRGGDQCYLKYIRGETLPTSDANTTAGIYASDIDTGNHDDDEDKWRSRTYGLYALSGATSTGQKYVYMMFRYNQDITFYEYPIQLNMGIGLSITGVDKSGIRKAYAAGLRSNLDNVYYSSFSTYYSNMREQALHLCDPTATTTTVKVSENNVNSYQETVKNSNVTPTLYFYVPETIYLNPTNQKTFQYFVDRANDDTGALRSTKNTSGNVYFHCPGATSVSISASLSGATITVGTDSNSAADTFASTSMSGSLSTAQTAATNSTIEWTATYTLEGNTYTAKNYTIVYSPYLHSVAAGAQELSNGSSGSSYQTSSTSYISGIHSVYAWESGKTTFRYFYGTTQIDSTNHDNIKYWTPNPCELSMTADNGGTGAIAYPIRNPNVASISWNSTSDHNHRNTSSGATGFRYTARKSTEGGVTCTGGVGQIYVDTSRYSTMNIPNFQMKTFFNSGCNFTYKVEVITKAVDYNVSGAAQQTVNVVNQTTSSNYNNTNKETTVSSINVNSGIKSIILHSNTNNSGKNKRSSDAYVGCQVVAFSKADLRKEIDEAISMGKYASWYPQGAWTTYQTRLKEAVTALGTLTKTSTEVTTAKDNLHTAIGGLNKLKGTLSAEHRSTATGNKPLGTDTSKSYDYGDTTKAGHNEYQGYEYKEADRTVNYFNGADFYSALASKTGNNVSNVSWNETTQTLSVTGTGGDNFTTMPIETNHNLFYFPITPGTSYKLSYTATGNTAQAYVFCLKDKDTWASNEPGLSNPYRGNYGTGNQSISGTASSDCHYLTFRFGNTSACTTTFTNIKLIIGTSPQKITATEDIINNNCCQKTEYTFWYTPKTYDVTYDVGETGIFGPDNESGAITFSDIATYDAPFTVGAVTNGGTETTAPKRIGYIFQNWINAIETEEANQTVAHGAAINPWQYDTDSVTFVAQYNLKPYKVSYNENGGNVVGGQSLVINNNTNAEGTFKVKSKTDSEAMVYKTGYTLTGWSTLPTGGTELPFDTEGVLIQTLANDQDTLGDKDTLYVYAQWEINKYTVSVKSYLDNAVSTAGGKFNISLSNSGEGYSQSATAQTSYTKTDEVPYNTSYTVSNNSANEGYHFDHIDVNGTTTTDTSKTGYVTANLNIGVYFKPNQYTINFYQNFSASDNEYTSLTGVKYNSEQTNPIPTRPGYTFNGWYDDRDNGNQVYGTGSKITIKYHGNQNAPAVNLYAHWTAKTITVSYSNGSYGGTVPSNHTFTYDQSVTVKGATADGASMAPPPAIKVRFNTNGGTIAGNLDGTDGGYKYLNSNYSFNGWKSGANETVYQPGSYNDNLGSTGENITLTAQWKQAGISSLPTPTKTGSEFKGWFTSSSGDNQITASVSSPYVPTATGTLVARWEPFKSSVTLYAYCNTAGNTTLWTESTVGGTVSGGGTGLEYGAALNITATANTGYEFAGWYTGAPAGGQTWGDTTVEPLTSIPDGRNNIVYYARFDVVYCTVAAYAYSNTAANQSSYTNVATGGTVAVDANTTGTAGATSSGRVIQGSSATLTATAATGYHFDGWYKDAALTQAETNKDSNPLSVAFTSKNATVNRYAKFSINNSTLKVDPNGGKFSDNTAAVKSFTQAYNTTLKPVPVPTQKTGYTFDGWEKKTGETFYGEFSSLNKDDDPFSYKFPSNNNAISTIIAKWAPISYSITYNLADGTKKTDGSYPENAAYDTVFAVSAPTKVGYDFRGWKVTSGLDSATAKWGVTNAPATSIEDANTPCANGTEGDVYFKNLRSTTGSVTLTATWEIKKYTVTATAVANNASDENTYNTANVVNTGCSAEGPSSVVNHGSTATLTATAGEGYDFAGWYESSNVSGEAVSTSLTYIPEIRSDKTYYAKFSIKTYTVSATAVANTAANPNSFNDTTAANENCRVTTSANTAKYKTQVTLTATAGTGYKFAGWYESDNVSGSPVDTNATYEPAIKANMTYYAKFTVESYKAYVYAYNNKNESYENNTNGGTVKIEGVSPTVAATTAGKDGEITIGYKGLFKVTAAPATGYTFEGWYTDDDLSIEATGATASDTYTATFSKKADTEYLYAKFKIKTPAITVYAYSNNGNETAYNNNTVGGSVVITGGVNVKNNSSTGSVATANVNYDTKATITATPATGYQFDGWYTAVTGGAGNTITAWTTQYSTSDSAETVNMPEAGLTYYAKFTAQSFTITFNANGGTPSTTATAYYNGTLPLARPTKTDSHLLGWSKTNTATTPDYPIENENLSVAEVNYLFDHSEYRTIYAVWKDFEYTTVVYAASNTGDAPDTYTVNTRGGTAALKTDVENIKTGEILLGEDGKITVTPATGYDFKEVRFSETDLELSGATISTPWGTTGDVMGTRHDGVRMAIVVFFEVHQYPVIVRAMSNSTTSDSFVNSAAGGSVKVSGGSAGSAMLESNVLYNNTTGVSFEAVVNTGYQFIGWYKNAGMTDLDTTNTTTTIIVSDTDDATDTVTASTESIGRWAKFAIRTYNAFVRANYYTQGIDTATGAGINGITGGTARVAIDLGNDTIGDSATTTDGNAVSIEAKYNEDIVYTATPVAGYEFAGWYYSEDTVDDYNVEIDDVNAYALDTSTTFKFVMPEENVRIVAKFVPRNFILVLNPTDGTSGPTAEVTLTYGQPVVLDVSAKPILTGSAFKGWDESPSATTVVYNHENDTCTISDTVVNRWFSNLTNGKFTIYAVWEEATYIVTLDDQGATDGEIPSVTVMVGELMPPLEIDGETKLPSLEGYKFDGYYSEPGGKGDQYYDKNGASVNTWTLEDDGTIYACWLCPILKEANYDKNTGKWTYTYETNNPEKTVTTDPQSSKIDTLQGITDAAPEGDSGAKFISSIDKTDSSDVVENNKKTADIDLNHYTQEALSSLLTSVTSTNTDAKRNALSQPELNLYTATVSHNVNLAFALNKKARETNKPSIKLYETASKLNSIEQRTINNRAKSATEVLYDYPTSADAGTYLYTGKQSTLTGEPVDYYIYTNSRTPVIALEIDDGTVGTSVANNTSSYPTDVSVATPEYDENIVTGTAESGNKTYTTGAVEASEDMSKAWFAPYVAAGIGVGNGTEQSKKDHDYNAKKVLYLTPSFTSDRMVSTTDEIVYTITPEDDAVEKNIGFTSSSIAEIPEKQADAYSSFTDENPTDNGEYESITVCICYHNAMNGESDEGGAAGDDYLQLRIDQPTVANQYGDLWLNQMHLFRTAGGASNWELPLVTESVYPVEDITFMDTGYVLGSFAYVFDATNEPTATGWAESGNYAAAKQAIIDSIYAAPSEFRDAIRDDSNSNHFKNGLGLFRIEGWSTNYYPKQESYVYAHLVDRWGNVFNKVWKNFNIDTVKVAVTGTVMNGFKLSESGGSTLASVALDGIEPEILTDLDSTYENKVFVTSGNKFTVSTGKPKSQIPMVVLDYAGNKISGKIPTDAEGNITYTVTDDCMDLSKGAYTFMLNDIEVNLYAREPEIVRKTEMASIALSGEPVSFSVVTMDNAAKLQLIENGQTRTYTPDMSNVEVVDNGDGTLTWNIKLNPLTTGDHTFQVKCKDNTGVWNDSDFELSTTIISKPPVKEDLKLKFENTSCNVKERPVLRLHAIEGAQAVRVMYENGYSKTVERSEDAVVSCVNGIEVWSFSAAGFEEPGEYTASAYVKYKDKWQKTDTVTCKITVNEPVKESAAIYSVKIIEKEIRCGETARFEVLTSSVTDKLQFVLPNDTYTVTAANAQITDNGDGTLTWKFSKKFSSTGANDIILKARSAATGWIEADNYGTVTVL